MPRRRKRKKERKKRKEQQEYIRCRSNVNDCNHRKKMDYRRIIKHLRTNKNIVEKNVPIVTCIINVEDSNVFKTTVFPPLK